MLFRSGNAWVSDNARVYGDGHIAKTDDYVVIGPVGTRNSFITLHRDLKIGVRINAGCFSGSLPEFMSRLTSCAEHKLYKRMIPMLVKELKKRMTPIKKKAGAQ